MRFILYILMLTSTVLSLCFFCTAQSQQNIGKDKMKDKIYKTDEEWKKILTPEQYQVTRKGGTECAFTGKYEKFKGKGIFKCVCCGNELFGSDTKFNSGTGWPSFFKPLSERSVETKSDNSHGMIRTEVLCARCDAHLGHVFPDGPQPTGLRFCINSAALVFEEKKDEKRLERAVFAAGCFWGVEERFRTTKGVVSTKVGYTGGKFVNPSYRDVCSDRTGHAEAVEIYFDPSEISYKELLNLFWTLHDPTSLNRQGPDYGTQYRSAIFYSSQEQKTEAEDSKANLDKSGKLKRPVVTEIKELQEFYPAEEYHQQYLKKKGIQACH